MNTFWRRRDEAKHEIEAHLAERIDELIHGCIRERVDEVLEALRTLSEP